MSEVYSYFAPCPLGMEQPLAQEIRDIGIADVQPQRAGVAFRGSLSDGYRACIWSRLASRILLELGRFPAADGDSLYAGAKAFPWEEHMSPEATFAFEFTSARSAIKHTNFGALKTKDGLADRFRERTGQRPSVDRRQPDIRFHIHVLEDVAAISLDMSEVRLHRRSWRGRSGSAPLKENLAAGILYLSKWPILAGEGKALVDPMCGIGTLVIEAALMLTRTAPGVLAEVTGPSGWLKHDAALFKFLIREARGEDKRGQPCPEPVLFGYDNDPGAIDAARRNARQAGVENQVRFARRELALVDPVPGRTGLFVVNPPYGERLAANRDLRLLYRRLGMTLKQRFAGWTGQIFTGNLEAAKDIGLRASARHPLYNGTIECRLLSYPMLPLKDGVTVATGSLEFANRLRKNRRKLKNWLKQENVSCYRIYDADLPEFAMVVDVYGQAVHVQENERPDTVDPLKAESRLHDGLVAICDSLDMSPELVFVKQRRRQRGRSQYEKEGESETFIRVREGGLVFLVNLTDYYDTGLFLDHRPVRELLRQKAEGKRFQNLRLDHLLSEK